MHRILYGLISDTLYLSFDIIWIRIQFKANATGLFMRRIYGAGDVPNWVQIT